MSRPSPARTGFTLIELSVVLVILGLLVGGVLVGRDLIEAATVRAQVSQLQQFSLAVQTFELKYDALPGDMTAASANAVGLPHNPGGGWVANGNGVFDSAFTPDNFSWTDTDEHSHFWPQLAAARLVSGSFSCRLWTPCFPYPGASYTGTPLSYPATVGAYFPATKLNPRYGVLPMTAPPLGGTGGWWMTGITSTSYTFGDGVPAFTPAQAYALDSKMDDGAPVSGAVKAVKVVGGTPSTDCPTGGGSCTFPDDNVAVLYYTPAGCATTGGARYNLNTTTATCRIAVKMN